MNQASKVVVVTGGSRGLGLNLVTDLLAQGYRVAACSRKRTKAIEELEARYKGAPPSFLWAPCQVGKESE